MAKTKWLRTILVDTMEAVAAGVDTFANYLDVLDSPVLYGLAIIKLNYLQNLLDHFIELSPNIPLDIISAFARLGCGVDIGLGLLILSGYVSALSRLANDEACAQQRDYFRQVIYQLVTAGHRISTTTLAAAISPTGYSALNYLISLRADIPMLGWMAMVKAACYENYDAVRLLYQSGVTLTTEVKGLEAFDAAEYEAESEQKTHETCFTPPNPTVLRLVAAGFKFLAPTLCMIKYCLSLAYSPMRQLNNLFDVFLGTMESASTFQQLEKCTFLIEQGVRLSCCCRHGLISSLSSSTTRWPSAGSYGNELWLDCKEEIGAQGLEVFELLLEAGVPPNGNIIGALVSTRPVPVQLIKRALDNGADVNFSRNVIEPLRSAVDMGREDLVKLLLDHGAWLDSFRFVPIDLDQSTLRIWQLLLKRWADTNRTGSTHGSDSSGLLHWVARTGWVEGAVFLLGHGYDVNNTCGWPVGDVVSSTALDLAACYGRVDMVQLLLNAGAMGGGDPGESGFDDAIRLAETRGHWTVADVIRSHAQFLRQIQEGNIAADGQETMLAAAEC